MGKEDFKAAYNGLFFPEGKLDSSATARVKISISLDGAWFDIPEMEVGPGVRVHDMAEWYVNDSEEVGNLETEPVPPGQPNEASPEPPKRELVGIRHVLYRKTEYLVQHLRENGEDIFIIQNQKSGKFIGAGAVTGRAVVKRYWEEDAS